MIDRKQYGRGVEERPLAREAELTGWVSSYESQRKKEVSCCVNSS